jgi:hypothetical protein
VWAEMEHVVLERLQRGIFIFQEVYKFNRNVLRKLKEMGGIVVSLYLEWEEGNRFDMTLFAPGITCSLCAYKQLQCYHSNITL